VVAALCAPTNLQGLPLEALPYEAQPN
jgi:hypothetical protein